MGSLVGSTLLHFRIEAELGQGGMGVVYRAADEKLGRPVALKVLPDSFAAGDERRQRFLREARSAAAVTHANIATVYEVGEAAGHVFIAMELVDGETLRARLEKGLSLEESVRIAKEIASGLARAHEKGIIHRDLKPENVIITRHGEVKILDFGLAKLGENDTPAGALGTAKTEVQITQEGLVLGTPAYMSPEQAMGEPLDARSDVFSFGVMFYEMLTGTRPFLGATAIAILLSASRDKPKLPSVLNPVVPVEIDRIVLHCLIPKDEGRYATGQHVLDALRTVLRDSSVSGTLSSGIPRISATPPTPDTIAVGSSGPWRWGLLALAGVAVAGLGVALQRAHPGPAASASASGSSSPSRPSVTTVVDLPLPASKQPEALTEYSAGMIALHDNTWSAAMRHFQRAAQIDPAMGLAHLRVAMTVWNTRALLRREEFAKAEELRGTLSPRDHVLLDALEPVLGRSRYDRVVSIERLTHASQTYPGDVEFYDWIALLEQGSPERALEASARATALDAKDGVAWMTKSEALAILGKIEEARSAIERCTTPAHRSAECQAVLSRIDAMEGKCDAYLTDTRIWFDSEPTAALPFAAALLKRGRPAASALELFDQGERAGADPFARVRAGFNRAKVATFFGDFAEADDLARKALAEIGSSETTRADYNLQLRGARERIDLLEEMGRTDDVRTVAQDFIVRSAGWTASAYSIDLSFPLQRLTVGPKLSNNDFEDRRTRWIERELAKGDYPGLVWTFAYAATALTPEEANRALEAQRRFPALTSYMWGHALVEPDAYAGRTYLVAGRAAEAVPYLRRAVDNCGGSMEPVVEMRAAVDLGQALQATGDMAGACAAYKRVLDRWGSAKPRSVTADRARELRKPLACPK